jgi:hypothetical protein
VILRTPVRIAFAPCGIESAIGDLRDERIEVIDEERVHSVADMFRLLHNVHVPVFRKLPHGLSAVWQECGREARSCSYHFSAAA